MKKILSFWIVVLGFIIVTTFILTGCADKEVVTQCLHGYTYGFWGGLLHGFIAPFDLVGMIFNDKITMFAQNNNGTWYSFGFLLGSGGWGIIGGRGIRNKRK